jgi:hypothetical protein
VFRGAVREIFLNTTAAFPGPQKMLLGLTLSNVDWSLTNDIVTTVGAVVTIIGTVGALIIGAIGLSTWRRQLKGTAEYEVARKAVLLTRQVCAAIQNVRNPMLRLRKEVVEAGRSLEEEQRIYAERMAKMPERWAELQTVAIETGAIWGQEAEKRFDPIGHLIGKLQAEIWLHFWLRGAYALPGVTIDNTPERVAANYRIVLRVSEDDEFSQSIKNAAHYVEVFFRQRIRG